MTCTYLAKHLRELSSTKTGSYPHKFLCRTDCSACADYQPWYKVGICSLTAEQAALKITTTKVKKCSMALNNNYSLTHFKYYSNVTQSSKWNLNLLVSIKFLNLFYIYIYIYLNKNRNIYWSEKSFTGLGAEDRCSSWGLVTHHYFSVDLFLHVERFSIKEWEVLGKISCSVCYRCDLTFY